jgi:hypothetical protein
LLVKLPPVVGRWERLTQQLAFIKSPVFGKSKGKLDRVWGAWNSERSFGFAQDDDKEE